MRIIRGKFKTRRYSVPKNFPSRPTTDFAKEGLFNILENRADLENLRILDLCAGTGSISIEFLSRESGTVVGVDLNFNCVRHLKKIAAELDCRKEFSIVKSDILKYLKNTEEQFDLIFADPPYAYDHHSQIIDVVFERELLKEGGELIVEHGKETDLSDRTQFDFCRTYGNVHFSFFNLEEE